MDTFDPKTGLIIPHNEPKKNEPIVEAHIIQPAKTVDLIGGASNPSVPTHGTVKDGDLANQDGQSITLPDDVKNQLPSVIKEDSANMVVYREMLAKAHDSLNGAQLGDINPGHPYWGLMNAARQYANERKL